MVPEMELLGRVVVKEVRDNAIWKFDTICSGEMRSNLALERLDAIRKLELDQGQLLLLRAIVISSIDDCLHNFLFMLEEHQENLDLRITLKNGASISAVEESDGLAGELYTDDGWIAKFTEYK